MLKNVRKRWKMLENGIKLRKFRKYYSKSMIQNTRTFIVVYCLGMFDRRDLEFNIFSENVSLNNNNTCHNWP